MTCTEEYKEHIEYTFHAFCVVVIRNAKYTDMLVINKEVQFWMQINLEHFLLTALTERLRHKRDCLNKDKITCSCVTLICA